MFVIFVVFAAFSVYSENWVGLFMDLGVILVILMLGYVRYREMSDLHRRWRIAKTLEKIITTPTMREEANSVIFTFIFPSPRLMEELEKLQTEKGST